MFYQYVKEFGVLCQAWNLIFHFCKDQRERDPFTLFSVYSPFVFEGFLFRFSEGKVTTFFLYLQTFLTLFLVFDVYLHLVTLNM